jgi:hypothetical protein
VILSMVCKTGDAVSGTTPTVPGTAAICLMVAVSETTFWTVTTTLKSLVALTDLNF